MTGGHTPLHRAVRAAQQLRCLGIGQQPLRPLDRPRGTRVRAGHLAAELVEEADVLFRIPCCMGSMSTIRTPGTPEADVGGRRASRRHRMPRAGLVAGTAGWQTGDPLHGSAVRSEEGQRAPGAACGPGRPKPCTPPLGSSWTTASACAAACAAAGISGLGGTRRPSPSAPRSRPACPRAQQPCRGLAAGHGPTGGAVPLRPAGRQGHPSPGRLGQQRRVGTLRAAAPGSSARGL